MESGPIIVLIETGPVARAQLPQQSPGKGIYAAWVSNPTDIPYFNTGRTGVLYERHHKNQYE